MQNEKNNFNSSSNTSGLSNRWFISNSFSKFNTMGLLRYAIRYCTTLGFGLYFAFLYVPISNAYGEVQFTADPNVGYVSFGGTGASTADVDLQYIPSASHTLCSVGLYLGKHANATDGIYLALYQNTGTTITSHSADVLITTTPDEEVLSGSDLPTGSVSLKEIPFENCYTLAGGTMYTIRIGRTGTYDSAKPFYVGRVTGTPSSSQYRSYSDAGGWTINTDSKTFYAYGYETYTTNFNYIPSSSTIANIVSSTLPLISYDDCTDQESEGYSSSTWGKLQCYTKNAIGTMINWLFVPSTAENSAFAFFRDELEGVTEVFPFNIFFDFVSVVETSAGNAESGSGTIQIDFPSSTPLSLTISSSTVATYLGDGYTTYRSIASSAIWAFLGLSIIFFFL